MIRALPHILSRVFGVPLLIQPSRLEALLAGLSAALLQRGSAEAPSLEAPSGSEPQPERPRGYRIEKGVAILPVRGVLVRRAGQMTPDSTPLQSYETLGRTLRAARSDSRARGILLEIDSPGGEAGGVFDLAREIRRTTGVKPVWAIANDDAMSAAYAIASGAERIWTTATGAAGSLGVVALHTDQSGFDAAAGVKFTYLYKGARKIDANPHMPLSKDARAQIQGEVNRLYDMLIETAARHRGLAPERLRATEAGIYFGDDAVGIGLADHVGTFEEAAAALAERVPPNSRRGATGMNSEQTGPNPGGEIESGTATTDPGPALSPPPAAVAPSAAPDPGATQGNVISFDQIHQAVAATRETAGEIAALCALAGYPDIAAEQIRSGATIDSVRRLLQARRAGDDATRQVVAIDTTATTARKPAGAEIEAAAAARFAAQAKAS